MSKAFFDNGIVSSITTTLNDKNITAFLNDPAHAKTRSVALVSLFTVITAYAISRPRSHSKKQEAPLVPYTFPMIGSSREYRKDPKAFIEKWSSTLGPMFRAHLFGRVHTVISAEYVRCIRKDDFNFEQARKKTFDLWLLLDAPSGGSYVVEKIHRTILKFTNAKMVANTPSIVEQLIAAEYDLIGDAQKPLELDNLRPFIEHLVAISSITNFVGPGFTKDEDLVETYKHLARDIAIELGDGNMLLETFPSISRLRMWYLGKYGNAVRKHRTNLIRLIAPIVDERLAAAENGKEDQGDFIQCIIEEAKITSADPERYMLVAKWLLAVVVVGNQSTRDNVTVILYRILQHSEVIDELLEEQKQVLEKHHGAGIDDTEDLVTSFTGEVIKDLVKLDSVCRETMRLRSFFLDYPHTYIGKSPFTFTNGYTIQPGQEVLLNLWGNHQDASVQRDGLGDYHQFKPFRFVGIDRPSTKIGEDFLIFGLGTHACPGRWFAMHQAKIILSMLLRRYQITPQETIIFHEGNRNHLPSGKVTFQKRQ
ncbi:hypothetical protein O0I10_003412 [Lichtheimia ornata]|uniref:Cytochrome p450 n=1 Tax=Lichtheimia ornata TaxID=688661 RepID=A0AAD7XXI0_9FUNG|nr:uncharacterized protein O0I10_003412 [Lichtheimia ornata]KAJ8660769.1 hypothetical protein O0I10_003412 [Lichtheimia ornata]